MNRNKQNKGPNFVVKVLYKKEYFDNLIYFQDTQPFWKTCKTFYYNRHCFGESNIALNKKDQIMTESCKVA